MLYYLVLAHNNLNQLDLLIKKIKTKNSEVFVHLDKKIKEFPKLKNIYYIKNRQDISRGGFSMIKAELAGLREIYPHMKGGDHIIIISGQCFPIKPMMEIESYISDLGNKSCMYYGSTPNVAKRKVEKYHFLDLKFNVPKKIDEFIYLIVELFYKKIGKPHRVPALNAILYVIANLFLPRRKYLTNKYNIYIGSQRMVLSCKHIKRILEFLKSDEGKRVFKHFKMSSCSDEMFFQTICLNSNIKNEIINNLLRYITYKWKWNNSPEVLTINNLNEIKQSNKLFARKFDVRIDKNIINYLLNL